MVSVDGGVRTFGTCYDSATGKVTEFGERHEQSRQRMWSLSHVANSIRAKIHLPGVCHKRRRNMRRAADRYEQRVRRLIDEMHHQMAHWLCTNYDVIIMPKFDVKRMSLRQCGSKLRTLGKKTVHKMYSLAHYRFRQFLGNKAKEHGCVLINPSEAHTTMTCGTCGKLNRSVGASKTFYCRYCGLTAGRDANAARNILLRYISTEAISVSPAIDGGSSSQQSAPQLALGLLPALSMTILRNLDTLDTVCLSVYSGEKFGQI